MRWAWVSGFAALTVSVLKQPCPQFGLGGFEQAYRSRQVGVWQELGPVRHRLVTPGHGPYSHPKSAIRRICWTCPRVRSPFDLYPSICR